jgi:hypothetical protein
LLGQQARALIGVGVAIGIGAFHNGFDTDFDADPDTDGRFVLIQYRTAEVPDPRRRAFWSGSRRTCGRIFAAISDRTCNEEPGQKAQASGQRLLRRGTQARFGDAVRI